MWQPCELLYICYLLTYKSVLSLVPRLFDTTLPARCCALVADACRFCSMAIDRRTDRQTDTVPLRGRSPLEAPTMTQEFGEKNYHFRSFPSLLPKSLRRSRTRGQIWRERAYSLCSNSIRPTSTCCGFVVGLRQVVQQIHRRLK